MQRRSFPATARWWLGIVLVAVGLSLVAAGAHAEPIHLQLDNGIEATVYAPEDILANWTVRDADHTWMIVDPSVRYELIPDVADPAVTNKGDGSFHPMSVQTVIEALAAVRTTGTNLAVQVFVLPYPRREILESSAREGMILLSPGVRPVSDYAVHFTVTHEVGHVYQYRYMPDSDVRTWQRYRDLRGIGDASVYFPGGAHKNRPHEIFAEDFRFLLGGDHANYSGSIENETLRLPDEVSGLQSFLRDLTAPALPPGPVASLATAPNPFNPSTEVRVEFQRDPSAGRALVRVFDAQGREVRQLFDGTPSTRLLRLPWDGRAEDGARVSSGVYFARLDYHDEVVAAKLLLLK